ncbi:MAG: ribonuclease E activity regulator RraA [Betaproteobacteria bacterium]|nr:ribonuclease E activity regulator RraA [Betaproteobacteria bacterium]
MVFKTTDLCDANEGRVRVLTPMFRSYGANIAFSGRIETVKVHEDNVLVRQALSQDGHGKVLVIDGGGSMRCALVGDQLAELAHRNGWEGIVVYGCIRDSSAINQISIGVRALNANPLKSVKKGAGDSDVPVNFGGVTFTPGHFLYADEDGIVVSESALE